MKSLFSRWLLPVLALAVVGTKLYGQDGLLDRIKSVETRNSYYEAQVQALAGQVKSTVDQLSAIKLQLDVISAKLSPATSTSAKGLEMGPSFQAQVCGPQGCSPQALQGHHVDQGQYYHRERLIDRLRARRGR